MFGRPAQLPLSSLSIAVSACGVVDRLLIIGESHLRRPTGAISGSHSILVATGEHWLGWSFGQPGLPQSFFVSREVFGTKIMAQHVFEIGNT